MKNPEKNLPTSMYGMETRPKIHRPDLREARMKASDIPALTARLFVTAATDPGA